jgi:hypothetical protein
VGLFVVVLADILTFYTFEMSSQYFEENQFDLFFPLDNSSFYETVELVVTDSYNEDMMKNSIESIGIKECLCIALQLSLVGYGNKTYGKVLLNGEEIDILDFFKKRGIKYNQKIGDKLGEKDITPGRLIRFFRFYIQRYLVVKNKSSYLYKKYCPNKNEKNQKNIFRGCEYLLEPGSDNEIAKELVLTYKNLDKIIDKNITEKIKRVLLAKGFTSSFLENI